MRRLSPVLAAAAWALLLTSAPAAAAPRSYTIVVDKMKFGALPTTVRAGDIIVWDNRDMFRHSATAKGAFDIDLPAGKVVKVRMKRDGTFAFICKYHPGMKGVLKVAR
ncbi:cupredoxin domain-containing protein [Sphingomonas sp. RG327]|jgi:plastocyanin|uniref:Cupredoxin domain-containing protein n=1 Tax=Sphingomonas anseongensis TaxID=2908207 RepID=A0ABT0RFI5_9SPHN|nr:cupredoxin domain-containing protein [Sphingomonas anseongensis]MCL6679042.1 cupredoxin domain-containing protein [Sphingomonas anseongensis]